MAWQESSGDVINKLHGVYNSLTHRMKHVVANFRKAQAAQSKSEDGDAKDDEGALPAHLNLRGDPTLQKLEPMLKELKALFESTSNGQVGVSEEEFIEAFAPVFVPDASKEELSQWFNSIDYDADGNVGWDEFCSFLMASHHIVSDKEEGNDFCLLPTQPEYFADAHKDCITHMLFNSTNDVYYSAGGDGMVKMWTPAMNAPPKVIHGCPPGSTIMDMQWIPTMNRLIILQLDRVAAVYDCSMLARSPRNALLRIFKGVDTGMVSGKIDKGRTVAHRLVEKNPQAMRSWHTMAPRQLKKLKNAEGSVSKDQSAEDLVDGIFGLNTDAQHHQELQALEATPLDELSCATMCIDFAPWVMGGAYLLGTETGHINIYHTRRLDASDDDITNYKPASKWKNHSSYVNKVLAVASLNGFISCSSDETIQVFNIEKEHVYSQMKDSTAVQLLHGFSRRENRGVYGFDFSSELNILASWGENRRFIVWNPLTATALFQRMEHTHPIKQVLFKPNHQLLSLSEDKTVKIWDTRTFRCLQTIVDKQQRLPEDRFRCLAWDEKRKTIVTGSSYPVLYRMRAVKDQIEAGICIQKQLCGHLQPVNMVLYNPRFGHIISIDNDNMFTWDIKTGRQVSKWCPDFLEGGHRITAACLGWRQRRLVTCADNGSVYMLNTISCTTLREYATGSTDELSSCLSVLINAGLPHAEALIFVAGFSNKILVFKDQEGLELSDSVGRPQHTLYMDGQGHAQCMEFSAPSRLLVGSQKGTLLLYNLNNMSLLSVSSGYSRMGPELQPTEVMRQVAKCVRGSQADVYRERPGAKAGKKKKLVERVGRAMGQTSTIPGASSFVAFHSITQKHVSANIEYLTFLNSSLVATLHGNGELCMWGIAKDTSQAAILSCIPASYSAGEAAHCMAYHSPSARLYIGDEEGYVSCFDVSSCMTERAEELTQSVPTLPVIDTSSNAPMSKLSEKVMAHRTAFTMLSVKRREGEGTRALNTRKPKLLSKPAKAREQTLPSQGVTSPTNPPTLASPASFAFKLNRAVEQSPADARTLRNDMGMRLTLCFRAHASGVNTMVLLKQGDGLFLVTGSSDFAVKMWTSAGSPVATLGTKEWPSFLSPSGDIKLDDTRKGKNGGRDSTLPPLVEGGAFTQPVDDCTQSHYFTTLFPADVLNTKVTRLGDIISRSSAERKDKTLTVPALDEGRLRTPGQEVMSLPDSPEKSQVLPSVKRSSVMYDEAEASRNVTRMLEFGRKRATSQEQKRMMELHSIAAKNANSLAGVDVSLQIALDKVKERQKQKHLAVTSSYSLEAPRNADFKELLEKQEWPARSQLSPLSQNQASILYCYSRPSIQMDIHNQSVERINEIRLMSPTQLCKSTGCDKPLPSRI